jgi:hypothetical protein
MKVFSALGFFFMAFGLINAISIGGPAVALSDIFFGTDIIYSNKPIRETSWGLIAIIGTFGSFLLSILFYSVKSKFKKVT